MYNVDDILKMLADGQTADDIAKSFADTLNAAIKKSKEEEEAAAAKAAEAKLKAQKESDTKIVIEVLVNYLIKYYPDAAEIIKNEEVNVNDFIYVVDEMIAELTPALKLANKLMPKSKEEDKNAPAPESSVKKTCAKPKVNVRTISNEEADKIINNFFKEAFSF